MFTWCIALTSSSASIHVCVYGCDDLQSAGVSRRTVALPSHVVASGTILALAFLLAPISIGASIAVFLAAPAPVPGVADTRPGDWVT